MLGNDHFKPFPNIAKLLYHKKNGTDPLVIYSIFPSYYIVVVFRDPLQGLYYY